ncbi:hypothetical protein BMF89_00235 [Arthrobacter sp. SRS-W-1-2016]|uniref:hypothetical protein n=1 Tax=Arthrobacter sp. SRS-W-1-2016 TaxID=1930254 RepID=UPI000990AAE8|nr:hypothetical protein [Arthrobacter sp. SRS-W-1-2016]OOP65310.1 hypothetical protein BMF89_00235 [Arthrobacter sp. SRS-W-1-2016]
MDVLSSWAAVTTVLQKIRQPNGMGTEWRLPVFAISALRPLLMPNVRTSDDRLAGPGTLHVFSGWSQAQLYLPITLQ